MTEDEQVAQRIVDGARYQIQAGTVDANWSLIEQQQWISLESLKVAIVAALHARREAILQQAALILAEGSDGVGGDWEAAEAAAAITKIAASCCKLERSGR